MLLHIKNNILVNRCFAQNVKEFSDLQVYIASDKRTNIYLVLNHIDQDYTLQNIPAVDRFSIYSIVKTKLKHIPNDSNSLKAAFLLSKPSKSEKSWQYMFVSVGLNDSINSWLELIASAGGNFKGMLMLPIEMIHMLNTILSDNNQGDTKTTDNIWNIIVVCTRTGGFRQLVTKNNKMVFTRLISFTDDTLPNIIAGSIYQEIQNTIQYLGRFDFHKNDLLNLCIVVPQDIKFGLTTIKFSESNVSIFTPYELSKILKLTHLINPSDKFCDTVLLYSILENKPTIVLHTKQTKEFSRLTLFNLYFPHFLLLALLLFIINTFFAFNLYSNDQRKNNLLQNGEFLKTQLQDLNNNYNVQKMYEISEIIDIHNRLSNFNYSPLSQIKYISRIKIDNLELKSFYWKIDTESNAMDIKLRYYLQSDSDVFHKYEDLKQNLNAVFYDHKIGFSELPSVIEVGEKDVIIDVNINKVAK